MLNQHAHEFVQAWVQKATRHRAKTLSGAYDRFFTLFVAYNALYTQATNQLLNRSVIEERDISERRSATEFVVEITGASRLRAHIRQHSQDSVAALLKALEIDGHHVCIGRRTGLPDADKERELIAQIKSHDDRAHALALLTVIYQIRCNMFHGHKVYAHVQIAPLRAAGDLLASVVALLHARLLAGEA